MTSLTNNVGLEDVHPRHSNLADVARLLETEGNWRLSLNGRNERDLLVNLCLTVARLEAEAGLMREAAMTQAATIATILETSTGLMAMHDAIERRVSVIDDPLRRVP